MTDERTPATVHVLHVASQRCRTCGEVETFSHLYSADEGPANRFGLGKKLIPCQSIDAFTPVHIVELPRGETPLCRMCAAKNAAIGTELWNRWQDTLMRKARATITTPISEKVPQREDFA